MFLLDKRNDFYNRNVIKERQKSSSKTVLMEGAACQYTVTPPAGCIIALNNSML